MRYINLRLTYFTYLHYTLQITDAITSSSSSSSISFSYFSSISSSTSTTSTITTNPTFGFVKLAYFFTDYSTLCQSHHGSPKDSLLGIAKAGYPSGWGTGIRGLMRGMATLPQGNQELLAVRDKVGRRPGELRVSKSMECDIFPSVLRHCWLGDRKGIRPVKKLDVALLVVMI